MAPELVSFLQIVVAPNLLLWLVAVVGIIYHSCRPSAPSGEGHDEKPTSPPPAEEFAGVFVLPSGQTTPSMVCPDSSVFVPQFTPFGTALPVKPRLFAVSETPRLSRSSAGSSQSGGLFGTIPSARLVAILEALDEGSDAEKEQQMCPHLEEVLALDMGFLEDSVFDSPEKATERRPAVPLAPQMRLWGSVAREVKEFHHSSSLQSSRF